VLRNARQKQKAFTKKQRILYEDTTERYHNTVFSTQIKPRP